MKRSSGVKREIIEISDDESSKQPPQKTVKKEAEEQFTSQATLDMHHKVAKLEKDYQAACRMAEKAQQRVALLENLLKKNKASEDTEKELKKKLTEVSAKLEEATRREDEMRKRVQTFVTMHTDKQLLDRATLMTAELTDKLHKANENTKKDLERIGELNQKLAQFEGTTQEKLQLQLQSQSKLVEELQMKIAETSAKLEKAKSEAAGRDEQLKGVCRIANEYEMGMNEAKARVVELENIIDKKPMIAPVVTDESEKNLIAELQTKLAETSTQLENVRSDAVRGEQQLQDRIGSLTRLLEAEQARLREERETELEKAKSEAASRDEQLKRLAKLEKDYQGVCRIANEYEMGMNEAKARVMELEDIIDKKPMIAPVVAAVAEKNLIAELQTKLTETSTQLETVRSDAAKLEQQLRDRIPETSAELEKTKSEAATSRDEQLNRLKKLEKDYQGVCRIANEYEMGMNEAKARVMELENIIDKKPIIAPVVVDDSEKNRVAELQAK